MVVKYVKVNVWVVRQYGIYLPSYHPCINLFVAEQPIKLQDALASLDFPQNEDDMQWIHARQHAKVDKVCFKGL